MAGVGATRVPAANVVECHNAPTLAVPSLHSPAGAVRPCRRRLPRRATLPAARARCYCRGMQVVDRHLELGGLSFHVLERGAAEAPAVLLLHRFNQTAHSWDELAQRLTRESPPTIALDHPR